MIIAKDKMENDEEINNLITCEGEEEILSKMILEYDDASLFNLGNKIKMYEEEFEEEIFNLVQEKKEELCEELSSLEDFQKDFREFKLNIKFEKLSNNLQKLENIIINPYEQLDSQIKEIEEINNEIINKKKIIKFSEYISLIDNSNNPDPLILGK